MNEKLNEYLHEFAALFAEECQLMHLVNTVYDETPRDCDDVFVSDDDRDIKMANDCYVSFKIQEDELSVKEIVGHYLAPTASQLARTFDRLILSNVYRLQMLSEPFSWAAWQSAKRQLKHGGAGEDTLLFVNPRSEATLLKDGRFTDASVFDHDVFMNQNLPWVWSGRTHPAIIKEADKWSIVIDNDCPVQIGQSMETNGRVQCVIEATEKGLEGQKLWADTDTVGRVGDIVRFGGLGAYNLVMGRDTFTVATCPTGNGQSTLVRNGICCSGEMLEDGGIVIRILMGIDVTNPSHAVVIKE